MSSLELMARAGEKWPPGRSAGSKSLCLGFVAIMGDCPRADCLPSGAEGPRPIYSAPAEALRPSSAEALQVLGDSPRAAGPGRGGCGFTSHICT